MCFRYYVPFASVDIYVISKTKIETKTFDMLNIPWGLSLLLFTVWTTYL